MFTRRQMIARLRDAAREWPAVVLSGARRTGKTTAFQHAFPKAQYVLLEDPDVELRARSDPRGFLDGLQPPVLFDEIQNVPELFRYVRTKIDRNQRLAGQWFFTGSLELSIREAQPGRLS